MNRFLDRARPWAGIALAFIGGLAFLRYFSNYPIPEWPLKIFSIFTAAFFILACWSAGDWLMAFVERRDPLFFAEPLLRLWILPFALGAAFISCAVLVLGWVFPFDLSLKVRIFAFFLGVNSLYRLRRHTFSFPSVPSFSSPSKWLGLLGSILIGGGILVTLFASFSPITYYDSLVYHLALPARYLMDGKIRSIPFNLYSAFPGGFEMLVLSLMSLSGRIPADYAINLLGWTFSVSTSLLIGHWGKKLGGSQSGLLSMVLWWTMPAALLLSMGGYVDVPLAFFVTLSLYCFLRSDSRDVPSVWLIFSGVFVSMAASVKYTGGLTFLILAAALIVQGRLQKEKIKTKLLVFSLASLFPLSFWLLKNGVELGNPFFPFLYRIFGGRVGWPSGTAEGYFRMLTEYGETSQLIRQIFSLAWTASTNGLALGGGMDVLGDFGWGFLLFAGVSAITFWSPPKEIKFLWVYTFIHTIIWAATKPVLRFLFGIAPFYILLTVFVIERLYQSRKKWIRWATVAVGSGWLLSNFFLFFLIAGDLQLFTVSFGRDSRGSFLTRRLSYYEPYQFLEANRAALSPTLIIGEQRVYHLSVPYQSSNLFAPSAAAVICNQNNPEKLISYFKSEGFNSVLINQKELNRLGGPRALGFSAEGWLFLNHFLDVNSKPVMNMNGIEVRQIFA